MLKGIILSKLLVSVFIFLFSFSAMACIPCAKDSVAFINTQVQPDFPPSYKSEESNGTVTFTVDVVGLGEIRNINILKMFPKDMPEEVMIKLINKSSYRLKAALEEKAFLPCAVKAQEFTFEFQLPQKIKFDIKLDL